MPYLICKRGRINFESFGSGNRSLLFLHGTAGNCQHFASQLEFFSRNYRVIAVDLRGHGLTECPDTSFRIEDFSSDILDVIQRLALPHITAVGHSLGGLIALDLASQRVSPFEQVVMLDTPVFIPPPIASHLQSLSSEFYGDRFEQALHDFAMQFFFTPESPPNLRNKLLSDLANFPKHTFLAIWESMTTYDTQIAARLCQVPLLYIHGTSPSDLNCFRGMTPHLLTESTTHSGHYQQLEVPEQINSIIQRFLETSRPADSLPIHAYY